MLTLPFPPSILRPNDRSHWRSKAPVAAKYRIDCHLLTSGHMAALGFKCPDLPDGKRPLDITFYPPNNRWDIDAMLSACKPLLDGVADAWGLNDKVFRPITLDVGPADKKDPRVEISFLTLYDLHQIPVDGFRDYPVDIAERIRSSINSWERTRPLIKFATKIVKPSDKKVLRVWRIK